MFGPAPSEKRGIPPPRAGGFHIQRPKTAAGGREQAGPGRVGGNGGGPLSGFAGLQPQLHPAQSAQTQMTVAGSLQNQQDSSDNDYAQTVQKIEHEIADLRKELHTSMLKIEGSDGGGGDFGGISKDSLIARYGPRLQQSHGELLKELETRAALTQTGLGTSQKQPIGQSPSDSEVSIKQVHKFEKDLSELRHEIKMLSTSDAGVDSNFNLDTALVAEFGTRLKKSHDGLLDELSARLSKKKQDEQRQYRDQVTDYAQEEAIMQSKQGISDTGKNQNPYGVDNISSLDADTIDARDELMMLLRQKFFSQVDIDVSRASEGNTNTYVTVERLIRVIEDDTTLSTWLHRLGRLDGVTDKTETLRVVLDRMKQSHPHSGITWQEFRSYFTRKGYHKQPMVAYSQEASDPNPNYSVEFVKMDESHWIELKRIFDGFGSANVSVRRFLDEVRKSPKSVFVSNDWMRRLVLDKVFDHLLGGLREVVLGEALEYLSEQHLYEAHTWRFIEQKMKSAPSKRLPKILDYVPDADQDHIAGMAWLEQKHKVDLKMLRRIHEVYRHCMPNVQKTNIGVKKTDFILQLKKSANLIHECHRRSMMKDHERDSKYPLWSEIIPNLALHEANTILWSDVLQAVKLSCDCYKGLVQLPLKRSPWLNDKQKSNLPPNADPALGPDHDYSPQSQSRLPPPVNTKLNVSDPLNYSQTSLGKSMSPNLLNQDGNYVGQLLRQEDIPPIFTGKTEDNFVTRGTTMNAGSRSPSAPQQQGASNCTTTQIVTKDPRIIVVVIDTDSSTFLKTQALEAWLETIREQLCKSLQLDISMTELKHLGDAGRLRPGRLQLLFETPEINCEQIQQNLNFARDDTVRLDTILGYRVLDLQYNGTVYIEAGTWIHEPSADNSGSGGFQGIESNRARSQTPKKNKGYNNYSYADPNIMKSPYRAPTFCQKDSYWDTRQNSRIRERRFKEQLEELERAQMPDTTFVATPVPRSTYVAKYAHIEAAEAQKREIEENNNTLNQSQKSSKQINIKDPQTNSMTGTVNSKKTVPDSETVNTLCKEHAKYKLYKANRSKSSGALNHKLYNALYNKNSKDQGRNKKSKSKDNMNSNNAPFQRKTSIPDFKQLHAAQERELERRKLQNQFLTKPKPFVFTAKSRVIKMPETEDMTSIKALSRNINARSRPNLSESEANAAVAPRSTAKMTHYQQYRAQQIREQRQQEAARQAELESYLDKVNNPETKKRIQNTFAGYQRDSEMEQERLTYDKRKSMIQSEKRWNREVAKMHERIQQRPLLMERTQLEQARERARQRALLRVRSALVEKGIENVDDHFNRDELRVLDGM